MTRLLRSIVLYTAMAIGAALALAQFVRGDSGATGSAETENRQARATRGNIRRWGFRIAGFLAVAALGASLVAVSGIVPIKASSGHWAITAWLLNFTMRRSVVTHSLGTQTPWLDDPALVMKGAGHYEIGCRPCHGGPDLSHQPRIAQGMTPHPPNLSQQVSMWDADELFYIVKHGVKFTGMPAWPAQNRDDEVWAVVAFLLTLPTLSADEYKRLAHGASSRANGAAPLHELLGPQTVAPAVTESCERCHGIDGLGRNLGAFPKLAGQKPEYLAASLDAYARGWRSSGIMEPIAAGLSPEETAELARYYAALGSKARNRETSALEADPKLMSSTELGMNSRGSGSLSSASPIERGRNIAMNGIPNQRVPACSDCHGPSEFPRNPNYPALAGQHADYLVLQLTLFKKQARGGTAYAHLMRPVGAGLKTDQMRDVALYYESLPRSSKFNVQSSR
jgi:cytochrome c553